MERFRVAAALEQHFCFFNTLVGSRFIYTVLSVVCMKQIEFLEVQCQ